MTLTLATELKNYSFDEIMSWHGHIYRELENRRTQHVIINEKNYFIKQHFGVGWKEIFKNLLQFRLPIISAKNEWQALQILQKLGIPAPEIVGYGSRGRNPATRQSFIITRQLPTAMSLEDLGKYWNNRSPVLKYKLIKEISRIARTLHNNGINHRDFYICHFLMDLIEYKKVNQNIKLYLIDLHRAQIRTQTRKRWIIKDLAGLYFSSKDIGLTQRDLWRFIKTYRNTSLREVFNKETTFWWKVKKRGDKLYRKHGKN